MTEKGLPMHSPEPWYKEGLNFECTGCGKCCTGSPGYVWVSEKEIILLAQHFNLSVEEFSRRYLRMLGNRLSLKEHASTYDCVFLKDKKCQVYHLRPTQCRTFPWWVHNLQSEADWEEASRYCEGIRPEKPLVPLETIQQQLAIQSE